jgi:SAM-dependent methyltransferase
MSEPAPDATAPAEATVRVIARREVQGFVDRFEAPNMLSGWAVRHNHDGALSIKIFADARLIGEGSTGRPRPPLPGNCGFSVSLSRPIELSDLYQNRVRAYAVADSGRLEPLRVWPKLFPAEWRHEQRANDMRLGRNIEQLIADRMSAAARLYITAGSLLPPICTAAALRNSIERDGLRGFVPDMDMSSVLDCLQRDHLPIPARENRENYGAGDDAFYWLFGLDDCFKVKRTLKEQGIARDRVLDFGGATGRVFRHFATQDVFTDIYACDLKVINIKWCKINLPSEFKVFLNTIVPSLPFPDHFFDAVTGFSVFTHIDEFEEAWLLELSRILRPGGLAYLTIHNEHTWKILPTNLERTLRTTPGAADVDFEEDMDFDRKAFTHANACNVFHSGEYIRRYWGRFFDIEAIRPGDHHIQSVVIARKAGGGRRSRLRTGAGVVQPSTRSSIRRRNRIRA